jgi:hypothetical protein
MDEERLAAADAVAAAWRIPYLTRPAVPRVSIANGRCASAPANGSRRHHRLAYFDGDTWHIVDYKTDADFTARRVITRRSSAGTSMRPLN